MLAVTQFSIFAEVDHTRRSMYAGSFVTLETLSYRHSNMVLAVEFLHTCGCHDDQVLYDDVWQVTATDWDAGENGRLYYSVPDKISSVFHVDQRGVISAHESIDRERYAAFRFPVLAVDSASKSRKTGSARVIITVDDVNDERPVFLQPTYLFTVEENQPAATMVCIRHSFSQSVAQSFIFFV